jgi:hypothetical protein
LIHEHNDEESYSGFEILGYADASLSALDEFKKYLLSIINILDEEDHQFALK